MHDTRIGLEASVAPALKCPECGKTCSGAQGLGRHRQVIHGVAGKSAKRKATRRRTRRPKAEPTTPLAVAARRPAPVAFDVPGDSQPAATDPLHYCPGCGFDLEAARMHLHPSARVGAYIRCPQCKCNLGVVGMVMRPELQAIPPEQAVMLVEVARRVMQTIAR